MNTMRKSMIINRKRMLRTELLRITGKFNILKRFMIISSLSTNRILSTDITTLVTSLGCYSNPTNYTSEAYYGPQSTDTYSSVYHTTTDNVIITYNVITTTQTTTIRGGLVDRSVVMAKKFLWGC
jgi:hypothetical protein